MKGLPFLNVMPGLHLTSPISLLDEGGQERGPVPSSFFLNASGMTDILEFIILLLSSVMRLVFFLSPVSPFCVS
jgi:hypothetical protein